MAVYKYKEALSHKSYIERNTPQRVAYFLGVFLYCVASTAAAVDSETWHYGLDNVGNITSRGTDSQNPTHNYGYDGVYRLTDETNPSNTDQYSYDANGNRTSFTRDGTSTSYQIDSNSNRLTQVGSDPRTYDNIGNTKTDRNGTRTFTYNQAGRLIQVHENSQPLATYTYNAQGQRTIKTTPSGTTYYMYDGRGRLLGEYDDTGQPIKEYVRLDGEPIAQLESSNITYLHSDHLATPRKATNEAGDVVWKWDSEAFGNKLPESSGTTVNLRFPGQHFDLETGLNYNYYRYYDPNTGRYITSDPIGLNGGLNTYGYVEGNPLNKVDPLGQLGMSYGGNVASPYYGVGGGGEGGMVEIKCCEGGTIRKNRYIYYEAGPSWGLSAKAGLSMSIVVVNRGETPSCKDLNPSPWRVDILFFSITNSGIDAHMGLGLAARYNLVRGYKLFHSFDTGECCKE